MPSQIKVDEIKNVAGQYKIKTDTFEGQTTAGSITVQGEGSATTNLQQGLTKSHNRFNFDGNSVTGSFNQSGCVDIGSPTSPVRAPPPRAAPPNPPITFCLTPSMMESLLTYTYTPLAAMALDKAKDATASTFTIFCIFYFSSDLFIKDCL